MAYSDAMSIANKLVRQSVSLPARVARQVKSLAKTSNTSANRIIVDLIESGIEAGSRKESAFSNWPTAWRIPAMRKSRNVSRKNWPA